MAERQTLEELVDELQDAGGKDSVSVGELVGHFEDRSLGVLLAFLGVVGLIPLIGGLPGAPIVLALLVVTLVGQSFLPGANGVWLPAFVRERYVDKDRLADILERGRPWARRVDHQTGPRFETLASSPPARVLIAVCAAALGVSLVPLGLIPGAIAAPCAGLVVFGLALMARDGVLALLGWGLAAGSGALLLWML